MPSVSTIHGLWAVKMGSTWIGGINRTSASLNLDVRQEPTSGDVYSRFQSIYSIKPMASFATRNLVTALDNVGLSGEQITSGNTLLLYGQQQLEGGSRTTGANHRIYTINEGLIVPRRLTCEHQGDAELMYEVLTTYDGTNNPITVADSQNLGTHPGDTERFTIGEVVLTDVDANAFTFDHIRKVEIDFGIQAETIGSDSDIYDTFARIVEIQPSVTITGINLHWFGSSLLTILGENIRHSGTNIVFQKRAAGATFVAGATQEHVGFTCAGLAHMDQILEAQGNGLHEVVLKIPLRYDGTNAPLVVDTTFAYS
jgi:hypothetical protein